MPVSCLTRSLKKNQSQKHASEIKYTEQKTRSGAIRYLPVNVPNSTTPSSSSPSTRRQSTVAPASHMMDVDSIDTTVGSSPSKQSRKPTKVCCCSLHLFSIKSERC